MVVEVGRNRIRADAMRAEHPHHLSQEPNGVQRGMHLQGDHAAGKCPLPMFSLCILLPNYESDAFRLTKRALCVHTGGNRVFDQRHKYELFLMKRGVAVLEKASQIVLTWPGHGGIVRLAITCVLMILIQSRCRYLGPSGHCTALQ